MIIWILRQLLLFRKALLAEDSPRSWAWGLALGMLIGLVPKGNLLAVALSVVLLSTRANLAVGMASALLFSFVGTLLDPLTHRIGLAVLEHPSLRPIGTRLYRLPLAPWTSFNNTVVLGSLLLGTLLLYPTYRLGLVLVQALARLRGAAGGEVEETPEETPEEVAENTAEETAERAEETAASDAGHAEPLPATPPILERSAP